MEVVFVGFVVVWCFVFYWLVRVVLFDLRFDRYLFGLEFYGLFFGFWVFFVVGFWLFVFSSCCIGCRDGIEVWIENIGWEGNVCVFWFFVVGYLNLRGFFVNVDKEVGWVSFYFLFCMMYLKCIYIVMLLYIE